MKKTLYIRLNFPADQTFLLKKAFVKQNKYLKLTIDLVR